jgi:hypothetical protein
MYHLILTRLIQMYRQYTIAPDDPLDPAIKTVPTLPTTLKRQCLRAGLSSSIVSVVPDIM